MLKRVFSYMREYKKYAWLGLLCIGVEVVLEITVPLLMADLIDYGVTNADGTYIIKKRSADGTLCSAGIDPWCRKCKIFRACRTGTRCKYKKGGVRETPVLFIFKYRPFQCVVACHAPDERCDEHPECGVHRYASVWAESGHAIFATSFAFRINSTLALVFLVALPTLAVLLILIIINVGPLYGRMQSAIDQVNRCIQENLTAIRVVKSYVRGDYEVEKFGVVNENLKSESEKAFGTAVLNMPAMQFVMYGTILGILLIGGRLINEGQMMIGQLTSFLSYVLLILNSLMMMSNVFLLMTRSLASAERIMEVIDEKIDITDENAKDIAVAKGEIEFDHVWFKYKDTAKEYVLSDVSFHIKPGQTVGIIGQTGSSKTTLVQLIPRLYDVTKGEVKIDGINVKEYPVRHLRDAVAMVLQKNTLFSGSLIDNLRWGNENATLDEIKEACQIACVDEFVDRLADGYDTEMGQEGVNVSGGQKQRICIARAILKKPKVLILDDSTSAVDTATEAKIRSGLAEKLPDMTKIIIAQRISSVRHADQIIIMDRGHVEAIGTHESLLRDNQIYQEIYASQKEGADL